MKVKPCPFCGGEAELVECDYGMYKTGFAVYCIGDCRVKLGVTGRLGEAYEWSPTFETEAEAAEAWNTRAERTCQDMDGWCSECAKYLMSSGYAYCPHCGAKVMER